MNIINRRQNENSNLKYLFGKQHFFDKSSNSYLLSVILLFVSFVIDTFLFVLRNDLSETFTNILLITAILLGILAAFPGYLSKEYAKKGADYLDLFESKVFGINRISKSNIKTLENDLKDLINEHKDLFEARCTNNGDEKGYKYKNWFEGITEESKNNAIIQCQRQCLSWSSAMFLINSVFLSVCVLLFVILLFLIFINCKLANFFLFILTNITGVISLTTMIINIIKKYTLAKKISKELDLLQKCKARYFVNHIEKELYSYRCLPTLTLSFAYFATYKRKHIEDTR